MAVGMGVLPDMLLWGTLFFCVGYAVFGVVGEMPEMKRRRSPRGRERRQHPDS